MTVPVRRRPVSAAQQHQQQPQHRHSRGGGGGADASVTSAVDQRLNDLFGEVASLRDELHHSGTAAAAHHRFSTPHHSDAFSPFRDAPALRPPSAHLYSPVTGAGPPSRLSAASTGRVPPPRVLEFTLTKSPRRSCGVGTGHDEIEPGDLLPPPDPAAQAAAAEAEAAAAAEKRVDARQETDEQEAERADCPERLKKLSGKEAEEEAAAAAEARRAAAAAVVAAAAEAEMVRSADIDRTEEVQVRASGPGGKLDMSMREDDLVLLDPRRHTHLRHLTGWTLTHVNGTEVTSHTEVRALVTELTTLRFALVDPPLLEPSAASEKGDSCCAVM